MQQEKFKVIGYIRNLINNVDKNLENFPKKDIEIKNRIRNSSYDLLELAYEVVKVNYGGFFTIFSTLFGSQEA